MRIHRKLRQSFLRTCSAGVLSLGVVAVMAPAASAATGIFSPDTVITLPSNALPVGATENYTLYGSSAYSISCPSATTCKALGSYQIGNDVLGYFVATFDGATQTGVLQLPTSPSMGSNPFPAAENGQISCSDANDCVAILQTINGDAISVETAGTWADAQPYNGQLVLNAVSCATPTACVVVGSDQNYNALVMTYDGSSWTTTTSKVAPSGDGTPTASPLYAVSCWSATNCTAAGVFTATLHTATTAMSVDLHSGVAQTPVAMAFTSVAPAAGFSPSSISCAAAGSCAVVGSDGGSPYLSTSVNGAWWYVTRANAPSDSPFNPAIGYLNGVSCAAAGDCTDTGLYLTANDQSGYHDVAMTGSVSARATAQLPAFSPGQDVANMESSNNAISCWSSNGCMTAGWFQSTPYAPAQAVVAVSGAAVPGIPTGVTLTPSDGTLAVTWTAPTLTGSGPITSYVATAGSKSCVATSGSTSCNITGLTNGTSYSVYVTAVNSFGAGPSSASVSATPAAVPDQATNFVGTPGNGQVTLTWTSGSNGGSPVTGYSVVVVNTANKKLNFTDNACANSPCVVDGLTNGVNYKFTVSAVNAIGNAPVSATITVNPGSAPTAPPDVVVVPASKKVTVSWQPAGANGRPVTSYKVSAGTSTCTTSKTTCTISGLTNGTPLTVTVTATNSLGVSAPSLPVSATPGSKAPAAPSAVRNLKAVITHPAGTTVLTWSAPTKTGGGILRYSLWMSLDNKNWTYIDQAAPTSTTYTQDFANTPTYYRIYAIGLNGVRSPVDSFKLNVG